MSRLLAITSGAMSWRSATACTAARSSAVSPGGGPLCRRLGAALGRAGEAGADRRQEALRVAVDRAGGEPAHLLELLDARHRPRRERGEHDVVGDEVGTDVGARRAPLPPCRQLA